MDQELEQRRRARKDLRLTIWPAFLWAFLSVLVIHYVAIQPSGWVRIVLVLIAAELLPPLIITWSEILADVRRGWLSHKPIPIDPPDHFTPLQNIRRRIGQALTINGVAMVCGAMAIACAAACISQTAASGVPLLCGGFAIINLLFAAIAIKITAATRRAMRGL